MANDPNVDKMLIQFLTDEQKNRAEGHTIKNVRLAQYQLGKMFERFKAEFDAFKLDVESRLEGHDDKFNAHAGLLSEHSEAINNLRRRARSGDDDIEMRTGEWDLEAIRRDVEEQKQKRIDSERAKQEEITWWKRSLVTWVIGALAFVATTTITILITLAIIGKK